MNSSSPTCSSSLRSASNAKIENVDAAMRTFEPGVISALRSSPSSSLTLSMIFTRSTSVPEASSAPDRRTHASTSVTWNFQSRPTRWAGMSFLAIQA